MSKVQNICVITFLSFTFIVGVLVFSRGFLLNRRIITEKSGKCISIPASSESADIDGSSFKRTDVSSYLNWCPPPSGHSKFIFLLVDALKFDFVSRMNYLSKIVNSNNKPNEFSNSFSCLFKFLADPPTTTMQRLKALTTGTMPTFIDASANFNSYEVEEDSLIHQLFSVGKRIAFLGDDTWLSLFPPKYFTSKFVEGHPSFNAWDLDTVDTAVNSSIRKIVTPELEKEWDVLLAHMLGVDHCGHRYGPNHPEMSRKLKETDDLIKFLYNSMSADTLLVIFGDHGMTNTGDHGGDSVDESESALIFLSKSSSVDLACPTKAGGGNVEVSQIDLVPTMSTLVGFPIPYSSIGQVIPGLLRSEIYNEAVAANVAQINQYIVHYSGGLNKTDLEEINPNTMQSSLQHLFEEVDKSFQNFKLSKTTAMEKVFIENALHYFSEVKTIGKNTWTQFDVPLMYTGIFISLLSVASLIIYVSALPIFAETNVKYSVLSWMWPSLSHWSILSTCLIRSNAMNGLLGIVISTLAGLLVFFAVTLCKLTRAIKTILSIKRSNANTMSNTGKQFKPNRLFTSILFSAHQKQLNFLKNLLNFQLRLEYSEIIAIILYACTCLGVFSNSFVINEGYILGSVLLAVVMVHLLCSRSALATLGISFNRTGDAEDNKHIVNLPIIKKHFKCSWSSFIFLALMIRISQTFFRCREELQDCQEEFLLHKQLSSLPSDWVVNKFVRYGIELVSLAVFVVVFRHWLMYRQISASSRPSALVAKYVPTILVVLNCAQRALQGLPFASLGSLHIRPVFENLPRVFHFVAMGSVVVLWWKPLCCVGRFRPFRRLRLCDFSETNNKEPETNVTSAVVKNHSSKITTSKSTNIEIKINGNPPPVETNENGECSSWESRKLDKMINLEKASSIVPAFGGENMSEDIFTSVILTMGILLVLLLVQVTSEGMSPSNSMIMYTAVCLAGIYRSTPNHNINSWSSVIAWTLASQYFFYGTGHQPVFSAIPWDSAFVGSSNGSSLGSSPESIMSWVYPILSVVGNLHVSQIIFTVSLPLLTYWKADKERPETLMGNIERKNAFIIYGKFLALHAFKLWTCLMCAAWQRRHLMVWKIFAPKLIFEAISFILTSSLVTLSMVFLTRIDYAFQRFVIEERRWFKEVVPAC